MTQLTDPTDVSPIHPEMEADITKFEEMLADYQAGRIPEDVFRVFRLNNGIYGQRQGGTSQMVRVKVPYGAMTADQLDLLADVVEDTGGGSTGVIQVKVYFSYRYTLGLFCQLIVFNCLAKCGKLGK